MWTYYQTGSLYLNDTHFCEGYAGRGAGKNNPDLESVPNVGPLPCGIYRICDARDGGHLGPLTMDLTPDPANKMYGRKDFRIHGDSIADPGNASDGCIILPHEVREHISENLDGDQRLLEVKRAREVIAQEETHAALH